MTMVNDAGVAMFNDAAQVLFPNYVPPAGPGIPITGLTAITAAQNSWKWDTQSFVAATMGGTPVIQGDQYTRLVLDVTAPCTLAVKAVPSQSSGLTLGCSVDYAIDGVASSLSLQYSTANVEQTLTITVTGTGTRRVELYEQRCYITALTPSSTATIIPYAAHASSCVYVGASGTEGYFAWDPTSFVGGVLVFLLSWVGRMKTLKRFDASYVIAHDQYGLQDYIASPSPVTAAAWVAANLVPRFTGTNRKVAVLEFGAGDYFHGVWTAAQITTFYGYVADAIHAADPTIEVFFKTMVVLNNPVEGTANAAGVTQQNMRDATAAVRTGRTGFVTITVGYNAGAQPAETDTTADLQDLLHLTPVAHRDKAYPYMRSVL